MATSADPAAELYERIDEALNVLGEDSCDCSERSDCPGCAYERREAKAVLVRALAAHDQQLCPTCHGHCYQSEPAELRTNANGTTCPVLPPLPDLWRQWCQVRLPAALLATYPRLRLFAPTRACRGVARAHRLENSSCRLCAVFDSEATAQNVNVLDATRAIVLCGNLLVPLVLESLLEFRSGRFWGLGYL